MYLEFYYLLFLFTLIVFFYSMVSKNYDERIVFSIFSIPLFLALAFGSLQIQLSSSTVAVSVISSPATAIIFGFFATLALINAYRNVLEVRRFNDE